MYTKEELEKLSDGELSLAILKIKTDNMAFDYHISKVKSTARCIVGTNGFGVIKTSFDINSWADMGPLIDSNGFIDFLLSVVRSKSGTLFTTWEKFQREYECSKLRAAAIVYLLMKGDK